MSRQLNKLTALQVNRLATPGLHGDGGGLTLQITKAGVKSWLFRYMRDGTAHGMGLGPTHTISLSEARQKALEARKQLIDGLNPLVVKKQKQQERLLERAKMMTFDQCSKAYIDAHKASWKNAKHIEQWTNTLRTYASPVFGDLPVASVDTGLVVRCLGPIWQSKTETASRLRGRIESVLGWATTSGFRTGENPARWKGHLENLLASINKSSRTKNHPSLHWQRIGEFIGALKTRDGTASRAVEFAILTASRSGEVRGAKWSEFDFKENLWTIPAERMKARREHQVPLSKAALGVLALMRQQSTTLHSDGAKTQMDQFVFAGTKEQALSDMSLTAVIRRMNSDVEKPIWIDAAGEGITVHGFRSTFRMWAAETTAYPREVAEHALAHQLPDAVERAYQRGTQFAKRQSLMAEWGAYCTKVRADAVVKSIHSKSA